MVSPGNMLGSLPLLGSLKAASSKGRNMTYTGFRRKLRISVPCFGPHIEASSRQGSSCSTQRPGLHGRPKQQHVSIRYKVVSQVANVQPKPRFRFRSNEAQWTVWLINTGYITVVNWGFCGFPRAKNQNRYISEAFSRTIVRLSRVNGFECIFPFLSWTISWGQKLPIDFPVIVPHVCKMS